MLLFQYIQTIRSVILTFLMTFLLVIFSIQELVIPSSMNSFSDYKIHSKLTLYIPNRQHLLHKNDLLTISIFTSVLASSLKCLNFPKYFFEPSASPLYTERHTEGTKINALFVDLPISVGEVINMMKIIFKSLLFLKAYYVVNILFPLILLKKNFKLPLNFSTKFSG